MTKSYAAMQLGAIRMEMIKQFYTRLSLFNLVVAMLALAILSPLALKLIRLCSLYIAG